MIKSLLHFNNPDNLAKDSIRDISWTVNGTIASSPDGKFGKCLSLSSNGYLQNNTIDLSLDKSWTLDMWFFASSLRIQSPFSIASYSSPRKGIFIENGDLYLGLLNNSWAHFDLGLPVNRWIHFALVNNASTIYAFVDGTEKIKRTNKDIVLHTTPEILIGTDRTITTLFNGLIDEFRISDEALWISDFTPPTHETSLSKYIYINKNNTVMGMKE